ncbi:sulfate permease II [Hypoxylon sp. NC0597]|nr:sulfate permease II [Hypoxylon sp. NC0597]
MVASKIFSALARGLGIDIDAHRRSVPDNLIQQGTESISPFEPFVEEPPSVKEWLLNQGGSRRGILSYFISLFPFVNWIRRYKLRWLFADATAGITLALVVIPQGLSYALLAGLSPEYGLYANVIATTFSGASLYWIFGTSKEVAVGATAVVSLLVGKTTSNLIDMHLGFTREEIAATHAFLAGCIFLIMGLLKLGWAVEFIPHVATSAFVTAAAITIALGQVPTLLGITGIYTRGPSYQVFLDTCKGLGRTKMDAAIGLTALALLTFIKRLCEYMITRQSCHAKQEDQEEIQGGAPTGNLSSWRKRREKVWTTINSLRLLFMVSLYTLISFVVNRNIPLNEAKVRILGPIPAGFRRVRPPPLQPDLIKALLPELPAAAIIIIIEHIAIAKSFGRKHGYSISTSQELISIAATNIAGPFVGAYASTASFGGSAVLSKAGARTALAGVFNACVLLLTLYVLQPVLYWIPMASLAALIIHAVANLIEPPAHVFRMWLISPSDFIIYFVGVFTSIFSSLENGIYVTIALSSAILLIRLARAQGRFLGRVRIRHYPKPSRCGYVARSSSSMSASNTRRGSSAPSRNVFFPLDRKDASNPLIRVELPRPGVFIYRFPDGFNYVNQAQHMDSLLEHIRKETRPTEIIQYEKPSDHEPAAPNTLETPESPGIQAAKPTLKAVILDFSTVNGTDTGAIDGLVELRDQLQRWAKPDLVQWHFANVEDRWVRRALAVAGFGYPTKDELKGSKNWSPVFTLAERERLRRTENSLFMEPSTLPTGVDASIDDAESGNAGVERAPEGTGRVAATHGINYPNFHVDLGAAVEAVTGLPTPDEDCLTV